MNQEFHTLVKDLRTLKQLLDSRLASIAACPEDKAFQTAGTVNFASPGAAPGAYEDFLRTYRPGFEERVILLLALVAHLQPDFFDQAIFQYFPQGGDLPVLGGIRGAHCRGMLPTGETAAFLIGGTDLERRLSVLRYFTEDHFFWRQQVLCLADVDNREPRMAGRIVLSPEYEAYFLSGKMGRPTFGTEFPAKRLATPLDWEDLVLHPHTAAQLEHINTWLRCNEELMKEREFANRIRPGYRALFYGPSGTGKTLSAALQGKRFGKEVYRIDLSQVVSKYIGETEKNLEKVFSRAEHRDWILFFDEADALFGKRSNVQSAHDRYANQEVAYLLQRVEDYPGLLVLASNYKHNIDAAFARRFNAVVHFPLPDAGERYRLWRKAIPGSLVPDFDPRELADKYEMSGAAIMNVTHFAALESIARRDTCIRLQDVLEGIRSEFRKEDKFF